MALYARPNRPELDAIKIPSACDIAWAAGIYEGEGTCRLCGRTKRGFMASVTQKDPELLYRLRDWFGGTVRDNGAGVGIHVWDACGDRARLFVAQVYSRLTARRRAQVDETGCLDFLKGAPLEGLSSEQLKTKLLFYYQEDFAGTWRGNEQRRKTASRETYQRNASDSNWVEGARERNRQARAAMTPEQKESSRIYQQKYYLNKKRKLQIVKSA